MNDTLGNQEKTIKQVKETVQELKNWNGGNEENTNRELAGYGKPR